MGRVTTRQALVVTPAARVLFRVPEGTLGDAGQAPLATVMVKGFAVPDGVIVVVIVAESLSGTSPVFVIVKVPVTDLPGARAVQLGEPELTVRFAVPAVIVAPGDAAAEAFR
jgi:hypothetical protein